MINGIRVISAELSDDYVLNDNGRTLTDNGVPVVGGEHNGDNCFCKLTNPVVSAWVKHHVKLGDGQYSWLDARGRACWRYCCYAMQYADPTKKVLYNSITN